MPAVSTLLVAILTVAPVAHPTTSSPVTSAEAPHAAVIASTKDGEPSLDVPPDVQEFFKRFGHPDAFRRVIQAVRCARAPTAGAVY
jgi:hypothetical protein